MILARMLRARLPHTGHRHTGRRHAGRRATAAGFALALVALTAAAPAGHTTASSPEHPRFASDSPLQLVSQTFDLQPTGAFTAVVGVPTEVDAATVARATLVVTAYNRVATPDAVTAALEGELPRAIDSVDLPVFLVSQPAPGQLAFAVSLETTTRTTSALQFPRPGLYPVVVELTADGNVLADLLTFVHRLPADGEPAEVALPVTVAMATDAPVVLDDNTDVVLDATTITELTHLAELMEASPIPVAVRVPPTLLAAVAANGTDGQALAQRLAAALAGKSVLSAPSLPLDPSAAAADGQQAVYTQWLRDGEDVLANVLGTSPVRTAVFTDRPLSVDGAALERDLGARLMVIPPDTFDGLDTAGTDPATIDTSQLVQVTVGTGITLPASVVDRDVAERLSTTSAEPTLSAIYTVTHLLAVRQQIADTDGDPARHGITIATTDLRLPDTATYTALAALLASADGIEPVTLDQLAVRTGSAADDGDPVVVTLPAVVAGSISNRMTMVQSLQREADSTASMLTGPDGRAADWNRVIGLLPTSALTDDQADMLATGLLTEFAAIRNSVEVPSGFRFTLTGRSGTVRVKVLNNGTIPLSVQVRITSAKLERQEPQLVELAPGEYTEVKLRIVARSNGDIPGTLQVYTPDGGIRLGPPAEFTASVKALSGLGNLVTGALALVLLTWWVRHVRQNRRTRAAQRHPVGTARTPHPGTSPDTSPDTSTDDTVEAPALSPDAEASTLPPS